MFDSKYQASGGYDGRTVSAAHCAQQPVELGFKPEELQEPTRSLVKRIVEIGGYIQAEELVQLAEQLPTAQVVIKWSSAPRSILPAKEALATITIREDSGNDYVREVFFSAGACDAIRQQL